MTYLVVDVETTGLNPLEHRIVAIGVSGEWGNRDILMGPEHETLKAFWKIVRKTDRPILVGFNFDFDWQFLKLRSLKHRLPIVHCEKYVERKDLRLILDSDRYKKGTTLDAYCEFLAIHDGDCISGADIPKLFEEGKLDEIRAHLDYDLVKTTELLKVMLECGVL